jgi:hypothetical protein
MFIVSCVCVCVRVRVRVRVRVCVSLYPSLAIIIDTVDEPV